MSATAILETCLDAKSGLSRSVKHLPRARPLCLAGQGKDDPPDQPQRSNQERAEGALSASFHHLFARCPTRQPALAALPSLAANRSSRLASLFSTSSLFNLSIGPLCLFIISPPSPSSETSSFVQNDRLITHAPKITCRFPAPTHPHPHDSTESLFLEFSPRCSRASIDKQTSRC